jgi:hypothetical protein
VLKEVLFKEYRGFSDRRIKRLEKGRRFTVDDRSAEDCGADGLLSYFCAIFADVVSSTELKVTLHGNVPDSPSVQAWVQQHGARVQQGTWGRSLDVTIAHGQQASLRSLAEAIRSIVARGAPRYSVPSYKYVCPRTARSLERLADTLDRAWG